MKNIYQTFQEIFQILSSCHNLGFTDAPVKVTDSQIITPIGDVTPILFNQKSKLKNQLVDLNLLKNSWLL